MAQVGGLQVVLASSVAWEGRLSRVDGLLAELWFSIQLFISLSSAERALSVLPCSCVFPPPLPQFDDDADVAAMWREVWEESTASGGAGLRLHMAEVVQVRRLGAALGCVAASSRILAWQHLALLPAPLPTPHPSSSQTLA